MSHPAVAPPRAIVDPVAPYPQPALNAALARMEERTAQWASATTDSPAYCLRRALARIELARDAHGRIVGPDAVLTAILPWLTRGLSALEVRPLPSRREIEDALPSAPRYSLTTKGRAALAGIVAQRECVWCDEEIRSTDQTITVGGRLMHDGGLPGTRTGCGAEWRELNDAPPPRPTVQTPTGPRTFTSFVRRCSGCDRDFYVSQEIMDEARREESIPPEITDAELAAEFEGCLSCGTGMLHEAEYVTDGVGLALARREG